MVKYTTDPITFKIDLDYDISEISEAIITFKQKNTTSDNQSESGEYYAFRNFSTDSLTMFILVVVFLLLVVCCFEASIYSVGILL